MLAVRDGDVRGNLADGSDARAVATRQLRSFSVRQRPFVAIAPGEDLDSCEWDRFPMPWASR
jgi:hypothetical protein